MDAIFFTWHSKKTILANYVHLFPQKLAGREACDALEKAGEMVGEIEAEQAGGLADVVTLHQQNFRLIDNVVVDVANSCATSCLVDNIAKITRRVGQLGCTPGNGGQAL